MDTTLDVQRAAFEFLKGFIGARMSVTEAGNALHLIAEKDGCFSILLSPELPPEHPLYCATNVLETHKHEAVDCVGYGIGKKIISVAIECAESGTVLCEIEEPDDWADYQDAEGKA